MDFEPRTTNNTLDLIVRTVSWPDTWCSNDGRWLLGEGTLHRSGRAGLRVHVHALTVDFARISHFLLRLALLALGVWTSPLLLTTWRQSTETCGRKNAQFLRRGCPHCSHIVSGQYLYESLVSCCSASIHSGFWQN